MGRIKTQLVKRITKEFIAKYGQSLTADFEKNKIVVDAHIKTSSRKIRNTIAGYATRIMRKKAA
ncbi:MAG TPA: 30S ribosomal protein S17e [Candidatus Nanoarchaeia archaeon]|nr:30S ribosomal protein S17e [Candidatus Nanoarchaeia archaeon]